MFSKFKSQFIIKATLSRIVVYAVSFTVIIALIVFVLLVLTMALDCVKNYSFDLSLNGFNTFFSELLSYKELIILLFTVFGIFLVIVRIREMSLANIIKLREEWKKELFQKLNEIEQKNSYMVEHFKMRADDMFDFLYSVNLKIKNKDVLALYFNKFFKGSIIQFEISAAENKIFNLKYLNNQIPFSLLHFRKLNKILLSPHYEYVECLTDFENLFRDEFNQQKKVL